MRSASGRVGSAANRAQEVGAVVVSVGVGGRAGELGEELASGLGLLAAGALDAGARDADRLAGGGGELDRFVE